MKREVKAGLFVAAIVCCLAAVLLGGGVLSRSRPPEASLHLAEEGATDAEGLSTGESMQDGLASADDGAVGESEGDADSIASDLADDITPPPEAEYDPLDALPAAGEDAVASREGNEGDEGDTAGDAPGGEPLAADSASAGETFIAEEPAVAVEEAPAGVEMAEAPTLALPALAVDGRAVPPVPPPADLVAAPRPPKYRYIVKEGESYWTISKVLFGGGRFYAEIQRSNPDLDPKKLRAGKVIAIPDLPDASPRKDLLATEAELGPKKPTVYLRRDKMHVIRPEDTLEAVAQMYYGKRHKWRHILRQNPELDPRRLRPGEKIIVPALVQ